MEDLSTEKALRKFSCNFSCKFVSTSFHRFISHTWDKHASMADFKLVCNISSCPRAYRNKLSFTRHVRTAHSWFYNKYYFLGNTRRKIIPMACDNSNKLPDSDDHHHDDNDEDSDQLHHNDEEQSGCNSDYQEPNLDYLNIVGSILLEAREIYHITTEATCFLSEKLMLLFEIDRRNFSKQIKGSLKKHNPCLQFNYETVAYFEAQSLYSKAFQTFTGRTALSNYVKSKKEYIEPNEITLDFNPDSSKFDTYQYVPIFSTLNAILQHEDVLGEVLSSYKKSKGDRLNEYSDGTCFSENELFSSDKKTLQIVLYHDDFNVVNPLGNKTVKHKISGFYFVLGNFASKYRCRLKDIHLLIVSPSFYINKYGYKRLLQPFLDDMKRLEKIGISIQFEASSYLFYGSLTMVIADNLAAHAIGGFQCGFSNVKRTCRFCNFQRSQLNDDVRTKEFVLRTKEGYTNNIKAIEVDPSLSSMYGINRDSCLNCLEYYHVTSGLPPDIAHDVFEGFAVDLVTNVIIHYIKAKLIMLAEFNNRIFSFSYSEIDKSNKPQVVKSKPLTVLKVKQTACEMWNLLRLMPFLIGDIIPYCDPVWTVYIEFLDILEQLCAPSFNRGELVALQTLIDSFFPKYLAVFPDENLKPKSHFLRHYPKMIEKFGPLIKTLRFEAKNGFLNLSCVSNTKNRKNMCQTIAKRHQMSMYLHYNQTNLLEPKLPRGISSQEVPVENFSDDIQNLLCCQLNLSKNDLLTVCKAAVINGQRYSKDEFVIMSFENDEFVFGKIYSVIFYQNTPWLLCQKMLVNRFNCHYHAYEVYCTDLWELTEVINLLDYHPLGSYEVKNKNLVPLRYYVSENHSQPV